MKMKEFCKYLRSAIKKNSPKFQTLPASNPMAALLNEEYDLTLDEMNALLRNVDLSQELNADNLLPFARFLETRWQRIKDTDASYFHRPKTPANLICLALARQISGCTNVHLLKLLMPTLELPDEALEQSRYAVMSDDNKRIIKIFDCLDKLHSDVIAGKTLCLRHTVSETGLSSEALSESEKARVIHYTDEINNYYKKLIGQEDYFSQRNQLRAAIKSRRNWGQIKSTYGTEGWNKLQANIAYAKACKAQLTTEPGPSQPILMVPAESALTSTPTPVAAPEIGAESSPEAVRNQRQEIIAAVKRRIHSHADLIKSLTHKKTERWEQFLDYFNLDELLILILGEIPSAPDFRTLFKQSFKEPTLYTEDTTHNRAVLFCFVHLYRIWRATQPQYGTNFFGISCGSSKKDKEDVVTILQDTLATVPELKDCSEVFEKHLADRAQNQPALQGAISNGIVGSLVRQIKNVTTGSLENLPSIKAACS